MLKSLWSFGKLGLDSDSSNQNTDRDDAYIFPKVDPQVDGPDCLRDCADCTVQYPARFNTNNSRQLYGGIKPVTTHVLVATGKADWVRKAETEEGSLMQAFERGAFKDKKGRMMVSASNLSIDPLDDSNNNSNTTDNSTSTKPTTLLVLPSFTFVDGVIQADLPEFMDRFVNSPSPIPPPSPNPNHRLTTRPCERDYMVLLCSHRTRDARCGISAPLIKRELERHLRPLGLARDDDDSRAGGVGIAFVSHVGGHKFAANVLVYRRKEEQMIWLARVRPEHCEGIVRFTILQGKVVRPEERLRGGFDLQRGLMSW
ncbi:hypothetical protein AJ80_04057 [Polytolypa hystricis UAMH7299]|uniref:Actin patches distal protein 1 n=1 Tax=Polytolypa hystricis (strain UAMH7299) TaxID=1447883 RepID=A0A2B7Y565_POLH7|nr:hypothetical protein AJ80_04057 [Polytolypa hystricis UAMH7299]